MRVLLIQAPLGRAYRNVFPYGLCCLASVLKPAHEVMIFDPNVVSDWKPEIKTRVERFRPEVIGVSLRNIDTVRENVPLLFHLAFRELLTWLKGIAPEIPLIAGGPGFSLFPEEIMERSPEIDFGVFLEGEESLPELLNSLDRSHLVPGIFYRSSGEIRFSGQRPAPDMASLPRVDRSLVDNRPYTALPYDIGVESKRGCGLCCAYCSYPHLNGQRVRLRPPGEVAEEIEDLVRRYQLTSFSFIDPVFDLPKEHCLAVCEEIIRRDLKVDWTAWFNGKEFDRELLLLAARLFFFSPDGYTDRALRGLHKHLGRKDIVRIYRLFRKYGQGLKLTLNFFGNSPDIRLLDFIRTLLFCARVKIFLSHGLQRVGMDYIRILPRTELHQIALRKGVLTAESDLLPDHPDGFKRLFYHEPGAPWVDPLFRWFDHWQGRGYAKDS